MPAAYSGDLRLRGIRLVEGGRSRHEAARLLGISASSAIKWHDRWRRTGRVEAKSSKGRSRSPLDAHKEFLLALIVVESDLTLEEIKGRLREKGIKTEISSIWRFYERNDISFKKNRARQRARQAGRRQGARRLERDSTPPSVRKPRLHR